MMCDANSCYFAISNERRDKFVMSYTTTNTFTNLVNQFRGLDVDQQLALFWFIYTEMGDSITPAAPSASTVSPEVAQGLFNQVEQMSQEEQLQLQRDLITRKNTLIGREYGALSDTTKLLFWYFLAQGMSKGSVVQVPQGYELSNEAQSLFQEIKKLDFGEQITLFRDYVAPMGVDPNAVEHDANTGL
ncbi:orange carotenoid protein N-terminal domain-containing protein [Leptolyngbya sp. AN02str]|uniref:orange carotenoid protein N-terminal domain-containing protein n=1 Tax=Leptolyngbya sp. AN02str TaxID=3423363 RepID=UPI003D31AA33